jgi:hypothetical protein
VSTFDHEKAVEACKRILPGDVSLISRELDATLRAAEHLEDDQALLLNAASRLSELLVIMTEAGERAA